MYENMENMTCDEINNLFTKERIKIRSEIKSYFDHCFDQNNDPLGKGPTDAELDELKED